MPRISQYFFKVAVVFLMIGILMGIQMAMSGHHNVIGAHAHTNLLGWVSSAIFGGYYALNPAKAQSRLAEAHFWIYTVSVAVMVPSLYALYIGYPAVEPLLAIVSVTAFIAVILFAYIVFSPARATAARIDGAALAQ